MLLKIISLFSTAWQFIKSNKTRFFVEIALAVCSAGISWGVTKLTSGKDLKACQDERLAMLEEARHNQATIEAIKYAGIISNLQTQITQANEKNLLQRQKNASDTIRRLSELEAMRAINAHIRQPSGNEGVRPKR
ncbi:hypothetical protein [Siphonobacter sp. SORGH_AS_0500]|uniref:hypothetical protein n=1 Tax=Siphonobacter sp. SORGH_AS_0500 TaxID=1864824 RepID=UPI0028639A81|nr:hypothetical protein [Siphonobacter sp. SORGH_AS_0500]MDR6195934.1 hypothetical protein [Siphonobacter sp. SORGH_AS_0500]